LKIRGNLLRILFGLNLLFFTFCILSPWAVNNGWRLVIDSRPGVSGWERWEFYWSFQAVSIPASKAIRMSVGDSWEFWAGSNERIVLQDFWFSNTMYYSGFTYEWIRIFIYQLLTMFFGIIALVFRWQKMKFLLMPCLFSMLSVLTGFLVLSRFDFLTLSNLPYHHISGGLFFAILSVLTFLALSISRYIMERKPKSS
jgi:hypothetical protein